MCKSKMKTDASEPTSRSRRSSRAPSSSSSTTTTTLNPLRSKDKPSSFDPSTSYASTTGFSYNSSNNSISGGSRASLSSVRDSLPENAYIYDFSEICAATNNFLAKRFSSSSSAWRCSLRGKDVVVFQRRFHHRLIDTSELRERLASICRSHHMSVIKLLGASISGQGSDNYIYLVYAFVSGANLADCLRNPKNPGFTVLSKWSSRMQIATDVAQGLEYIHHYTGLNHHLSHVHNHIKSSSLIITEPSFNAKICHFGTAELCGEIHSHSDSADEHASTKLKKSDSRNNRFQGTRGYMSPEFQSTGIPTQKSDVFAFGVVILELLCGEEPLKYKLDNQKREFNKVSIIQTAREAMESEELGRLRRWIDPRLKDSYPLEVAHKITRLALECVDVDPDKRPDMRHVAGKLSKHYVDSIKWASRITLPTDFISVSLAPR